MRGKEDKKKEEKDGMRKEEKKEERKKGRRESQVICQLNILSLKIIFCFHMSLHLQVAEDLVRRAVAVEISQSQVCTLQQSNRALLYYTILYYTMLYFTIL